MNAQAVLRALRFRERSCDDLSRVGPQEWERLLPWCDTCQITLLLGEVCGEALPQRIRGIVAEKYADYEMRLKLLKQELSDMAAQLCSEAVPFVLLKGFTHVPALCPDPVVRAQGDIDLWCPNGYAGEACTALRQIGYAPIRTSRSDRHIPPMAIPRQWRWNGRVSEVPISVEIHHRLWSDEGEHIPIGDLSGIWNRRELRTFDGQQYPVLCQPDLVGFAALHFFLHLIHGDLPLQRLWEIAYFLHQHSADRGFWSEWQCLHSPELQRVEALVFAIADGWFGCDLPEQALELRAQLPLAAQTWLRQFLFAPVEAENDSNKNYIWLRLAFMRGLAARGSVFLSGLAPPRIGALLQGSHSRASAAMILLNARRMLGRGIGNVCAIPPTLTGGIKWAARCCGFRRGIGAFFAANLLYDTGEFLFVILYSLYLLNLGFREDMVGLVASAMTAGTLIGSPIAAAVQTKIGLRGLLVTGAVGGGLAGLLRAVPLSHSLLLASAGLNGLLSSFWGVAYAPGVASVAEERNRSTVFAFFTAMAMSLGIVAGVGAVRMPEWVSIATGCSPITGKRAALGFSCALVLLSAIPAARLRLVAAPSSSRRVYPRGPFIRVFVAAILLYTFATASFNTFGIPYLSLHLHFSEHRIGSVFSTGQLLQVAAMLSAPLLIRKLGERRFVFITAAATALLLLLLAVGPAWASLGCYLAYLTFQYMGEPSLFALLMNRVGEHERSGASTLMLIAMSIASTLAAAVAGRFIAGLGYRIPLTVAAVIAGLAAGLFFILPNFTFHLPIGDNKEHENSYDLVSSCR